ncbi:MAG: insulinase family protein [Sandaracinaceae bacterium]|nr:insulinase family protein [Sandaracinaceae bacterium]
MRHGYERVGGVPFGAALEVERWRLKNGLTVLLLPDRSAPVVSYHTWFRVGSRYEEPGKTGLAHFFEHMMFNETASHGYGEFDRLMEEAGGETNAATWIDWTYYYESLPSEELPLAVTLEAERMARLVVRKAQVESEREVVANERRMAVDDSVRGKADELLSALAYGKTHPHGWPTIGWMEDIEGYRVADCRDFYRTWYAPNNATVVVAGDFDSTETIARIAEHYGGHRPAALPTRAAPAPSRQRKERRATMKWPTPSEKLLVGWHGPAEGDADHAVAELVHDLWIGGRSGRLRKRLVEDLEIVTRLRGGVGGLQHGGLFELWIELREGIPAARALEVVDDEVRRLLEQPVTEDELEKIKARCELFTLSSVETMGEKAYQVGFGETVVGDPSHVFARLEEVRSVTAADVRRVATKILQASRRSIVHVVPEAA